MRYYYCKNFPDEVVNGAVYLIHDNWNDWYYWVTQFKAYYVSHGGEPQSLGYIKIAQERMISQEDATGQENFKTNAPEIPIMFEGLTEDYFSVGQDENYYESLQALPNGVGRAILEDLKDCAFNLDHYSRHSDHPAMRKSLLRDIGERHLRERLHELAVGNSSLSGFNFSYLFPQKNTGGEEVRVTFDVRPKTTPPTNVHAIIGRNGVGKTTLFRGACSRCPQNPRR